MASYPVPTPDDPAHISRGYGASSHLDIGTNDFATTPANPMDSSPLSQSLQHSDSQRRGRFEETFDARTRGPSVLGDGEAPQRSSSRASTLNQGAAPSRSGTLKKRSSVKRSASLKRSGSRRSHAGSIRGVSIDDDQRVRHNSVFYTPVPTSGSPTEILANRFQAWRKLLKDLIANFREVANSYEHRSKSLLKVSNVLNNTDAPTNFMTEGGLNDANRILRDFYKQAVAEANKAKDVENEVINQLSGLRGDLSQKIKEIKSLSGDFKNSVEKEKETTRKCVAQLEESLELIDKDPSAVAGKGDPYVIRLGVDRQVERQIDEENYLHRAYLNLENSGRELESIVVGEIQKAYNALASILKRDADEIYATVDRLRSGPIGMPRDFEWNGFVLHDPHFVNPNIPMRRLEDIDYPGRNHPATTEVKAGMLERKSKYLKSYTAGWYVLSPTHLHEFKSADRIYTQPPVMSLYLPDQKLGTHSQPGGSSHKFVLKGRQAGSMHRGHTWVFRAETYDTMMQWYDDIKILTEKTGEERNAFVRQHARSVSQGTTRSVSSGGELEEDEADEVPYSANQSAIDQTVREKPLQRPSPGGRFPSDLNIDRNLQPRLSPSSGSSEVGNDLTTASGGLQHSHPYPTQRTTYDSTFAPAPLQQSQLQPDLQTPHTQADVMVNNPYEYQPQPPLQNETSQYTNPAVSSYQQAPVAQQPLPMDYQPMSAPIPTQAQPTLRANPSTAERHGSTYGDWFTPAVSGAAVGALGATAHNSQLHEHELGASQNTLPDRTTTTPMTTHTTTIPTPVTTSSFMPSEGDSLDATPSTSVKTSFLDGVEVAPAAVSSKVGNGGTGSHETEHIMPSMMRHNTDMSISDLHVPGEYPKVPRGA